jgi:hypothetical protein
MGHRVDVISPTQLHENSNHFERLPGAQAFVSVSNSSIQVTNTHKIIGPFFNHNPAFGFESDSEDDVDSEVDEGPAASGLNEGGKSRSRAKDVLGKESTRKGT